MKYASHKVPPLTLNTQGKLSAVVLLTCFVGLPWNRRVAKIRPLVPVLFLVISRENPTRELIWNWISKCSSLHLVCPRPWHTVIPDFYVCFSFASFRSLIKCCLSRQPFWTTLYKRHLFPWYFLLSFAYFSPLSTSQPHLKSARLSLSTYLSIYSSITIPTRKRQGLFLYWLPLYL